MAMEMWEIEHPEGRGGGPRLARRPLPGADRRPDVKLMIVIVAGWFDVEPAEHERFLQVREDHVAHVT